VAKHRKREKPGWRKRQIPGIWMWVVIGVVVLASLYFLARTLSHVTTEPPPVPVLATAKEDLVSLTRMLGDIEQDTTGLGLLPEQVRTQLRVVDSLAVERNWQETVNNLRRLLKSAAPDKAAALHAYLGFCYYQAASPDRSLYEYRKALLASDSTALAGRTAFDIGYLFQSRGLADSAEQYYAAARAVLPDSSPLRAAVLNNLGVLSEKTRDTARAREYYVAAAELTDTALDTRPARTLRDNLRRVTR
jgi:tetratricopeptide (TPR) repeat protein